MKAQYPQWITKIYGSIRASKTNPIQSQFKANQSQFWPIKANFGQLQGMAKPKQTQFKPNSSETGRILFETIDKVLLNRRLQKSVAKARESDIIFITKAIQDSFRKGDYGEHGGLRYLGCRFGGIFAPGRYH